MAAAADGYLSKPKARKRSPINGIRWGRIILDEGHQIKNHKRCAGAVTMATAWKLAGKKQNMHCGAAMYLIVSHIPVFVLLTQQDRQGPVCHRCGSTVDPNWDACPEPDL